MGVWADYKWWNEHLADVIFPVLEEPKPVYLFLEDEHRELLGKRLGRSAVEVDDALAGAVRKTLSREHPRRLFERHARLGEDWRAGQSRGEAPLVLPLLAVLTATAERMASEDGMSSQNFYGRLEELLRPAEPGYLGDAYREVGQSLWTTLNHWLEDEGGRRGLPTAAPVTSNRHIGYALSQVLVRRAERVRIQQLFADFALEPYTDVSAEELSPLLEAWITSSNGATSRLRASWKDSDARLRITELAAAELRQWDGVVEAEAVGNGSSGNLLLALELSSFPVRRMRLYPFVRGNAGGNGSDASIDTVTGPVPVHLISDGSGTMVVPGYSLAAVSLLNHTMRVMLGDGETLVRSPTAVAVFIFDRLGARWVETHKVSMGDEVRVLVLDELRNKTEELLREVARDGWSEMTMEVPEGWSLIGDITLVAQPAQRRWPEHLQRLIPVALFSLQLRGGAQVPGRRRNSWLAAEAPTIIGSGQPGMEIELVDHGEGDDSQPITLEIWADDGGGSIFVDLAAEELAVGNYEVLLTSVSERGPVARRRLVLASTDAVDKEQWLRAPTIVHDLKYPASALTLTTAGDVNARQVQGIPRFTMTPQYVAEPPPTPWWRLKREDPQVLRLSSQGPPACILEGAHTMDLEPGYDRETGRTRSGSGKCRYCGYTQNYSNDYLRNNRQWMKGKARLQGVRQRVAKSVHPPESQGPRESNRWQRAVAMLTVLGGGTSGRYLKHIAGVFEEGSASFLEMLLVIESIGLVEIARSASTFEVEGWQLTPKAIVATPHGTTLAGHWSSTARASLAKKLQAVGHELQEVASVFGPACFFTDASESWFAQEFHPDSLVLGGRAGFHLAHGLPPLSVVSRSLPRIPCPTSSGAECFQLQSASWRDTPTMEEPGAYRSGRFARKYIFRDARDVTEGTAALADYRTVKHLAASVLHGAPLMAYDERTQELITPLGAELPGMYSRAAALDSMDPPEARRGYRIYRGVQPDTAARLAYLLST